MIRFACSRCGKRYRKDDWLAGRRGKCSCGYVFRVPGMMVSPPSVSVPIVIADDTRLVTRPRKAGSGARSAIIATFFAGGLLLALLFGLRGAIVAQVPGLTPAIGGSKLNQKIYECYKTRSMRAGTDGVDYFATPTKITILSVERKEKIKHNEGTPYYAKVRVRFKDGTERVDDSWVFFVRAGKSVECTTWESLAWSNFLLDASKMPILPTDPDKIVNLTRP
jgi:hypothetical protein